MKKKTMLVISLILSVLSLVYFIVEYYGGTRYIKLHNYSTDRYLQDYTSTPKSSKNRVVVCFHTDSKGVKTLDPFLNSILDQSVRVDDIMLVIDDSEIDNVHEKYKKIVSVHGFKKKYDNNAALIMSVLTEPDANTKIILVDPETIYPPDFVETMISESDKHPNSIIYGSNTRSIKYGILVKPLFFDDKISKYQCGSTVSCSECLDKYSDRQSSFAECGNFYSKF